MYEALCVLCSEPVSWPHAWHGWCLNCSFRAHFRAGNPPSYSQLSAFMSLPLPISFSFIWNPSLSILSPSLSLSLWLTLYYASLSNHVIWHFSAFSLSIFSSPFAFYLSSFSSLHPSVLVCQPFSLSLLWFLSLSNLRLSALWHCQSCSHTCMRTHIHTHACTQSQSRTQALPWLRLAGLFELCGTALRDCVWLRVWHV